MYFILLLVKLVKCIYYIINCWKKKYNLVNLYKKMKIEKIVIPTGICYDEKLKAYSESAL